MIPKRPRFRPIALLCALSAALVLYAGCFSSITGDEDVSETVAADGSAGSNESNANANGGAGGSSGNTGGNVGSQESDQGSDDKDEPSEIIYKSAAELENAIKALMENPPAAKNVTLKAGGGGFTDDDFNGNSDIQKCLRALNEKDILVTLDLSGITGVTSIGEFAFSGCMSLASVTIPAGVTSIGISAFLDCVSLASVTIPASVTSIGPSAFTWCMSLASVTIPAGVTSIEVSAFSGCTSLASVTFADTSNWYATTSNNYTGGDPIDVTNPATNANNLKDDSGEWHRKKLYKTAQ